MSAIDAGRDRNWTPDYMRTLTLPPEQSRDESLNGRAKGRLKPAYSVSKPEPAKRQVQPKDIKPVSTQVRPVAALVVGPIARLQPLPQRPNVPKEPTKSNQMRRVTTPPPNVNIYI